MQFCQNFAQHIDKIMCMILKYCYFNLWCLFSFSRMLAVTSVSEFLLVYSTLRGWFCLQVMKPFVEALDYVGNIQAHSLWLKHHTGSHVWWTDFVCRFWSCISSGLHREHPGPQRKPCLMDCFCLQVLKLFVEALDYVENIQAHSLWLKHHTGSHVWQVDFVCRFWSCL